MLDHIRSNIFIHNLEIILSEDESKSVSERTNVFVSAMGEKRQSVEYYRENRNAGLPSKVIKDIKLGKLGEFYAEAGLRQLGFPKCDIDTEIRQSGQKGWVCDLPFNALDPNLPNCHVKTCDTWTKNFAGDLSWTFQLKNVNGGGGRDSLFGKPTSDDLIAFMYLDTVEGSKAKLMFTAPWRAIISQNLLQDPVVPRLKGLKKCVYFKQVETLFMKSN